MGDGCQNDNKTKKRKRNVGIYQIENHRITSFTLGHGKPEMDVLQKGSEIRCVDKKKKRFYYFLDTVPIKMQTFWSHCELIKTDSK